MTDFREGGLPLPSFIREQPRKDTSWIELRFYFTWMSSTTRKIVPRNCFPEDRPPKNHPCLITFRETAPWKIVLKNFIFLTITLKKQSKKCILKRVMKKGFWNFHIIKLYCCLLGLWRFFHKKKIFIIYLGRKTWKSGRT